MFLLVGDAWAADSKPSVATPRFDLPEIGDKPVAPQFAPAQMDFVQSWIRQAAPECPVDARAAVAQEFLEKLQLSEPAKLDRLLSSDFPARQFDSLLLRCAGAKLTGTAQAPLREKIAARRIAILLAQEHRGAAETPAQVAKIKAASDFQYHRLLEGRIDDDELLLLLKKPGQTEAKPVTTAPVVQKTLNAGEIVSEFARHNQVGTALLRLKAYAVEGRLTTGPGQVQQLLLFKMRPDRFRLVMQSGGLTRYLLGADHDRFWQQSAGQPYQVADGKNMGARRYLAEFTDPLFAREGYTFELLPEGGAGDRKYYRIGVHRSDGSGYVAWIDRGTYRLIGREEDNQAVARYTDFREVAGVTFAFREEVTDRAGRKVVLEISRITPNPGLMRDFFHPETEAGLDYFQLEKAAARAPTAAGTGS